jgi:DNA-binding transcriptional regulator YhcF (GntR family)
MDLYSVQVQYTVSRNAPISIDLASPVPVYRQIVEAVRTLLVEGELRPGDELPSVRRLAAELGIHFNTVAQAYRELAEEGWLEVSHGRAVRVVERAVPVRADAEAVERFRLRLRRLAAEARAQGLGVRAVARELRALAEGMD